MRQGCFASGKTEFGVISCVGGPTAAPDTAPDGRAGKKNAGYAFFFPRGGHQERCRLMPVKVFCSGSYISVTLSP